MDTRFIDRANVLGTAGPIDAIKRISGCPFRSENIAHSLMLGNSELNDGLLPGRHGEGIIEQIRRGHASRATEESDAGNWIENLLPSMCPSARN